MDSEEIQHTLCPPRFPVSDLLTPILLNLPNRWKSFSKYSGYKSLKTIDCYNHNYSNSNDNYN